MKKIIIIIIFFIILIPKVNASTDTANSYVLMDYNTGRVLLSKNKDRPMLIASITKIMTAIIAIESNKLEEVVKVDESILKAYGSCIYISVGEEITLSDLVYGLMLRSGNDAALMISNYLLKSEAAFVDKMNEKARSIGMKNTTFINSSGLDDENGNYSTSYDMALLMKYAMSNDIFKKIVGTKKHIVKTNYKTYAWTNKNKLLNTYNINGGKTGFTKQAGRTLVTSSSNLDMSFIVVTIKDSDDWNTHRTLHSYGYDNYITYKVLNKKRFNVFNEKYYDGTLYIKNNRYLILSKEEKGNLVSKIKLEKKRYYKNNDQVGINEIYLNEKLILEEKIYIKTTKKDNTIWSKLRKIIND